MDKTSGPDDSFLMITLNLFMPQIYLWTGRENEKGKNDDFLKKIVAIL